MKKIICIFGTRPEAIKMVPVIKELQKYPDQFRCVVCVTAQHRQMLDQVLEMFNICPDYDLNLMQAGQELFDISCNVLRALRPVLEEVSPDLVLVHGDTTTTMAAALAAYYCKIPVGHVEAGLRTGSKYAPFPEEINRRVAGCIADLHFAPTETARQNLLNEGVSAVSIFVTGNTVIDSLIMAKNKIESEKLNDQIIYKLISRFPTLNRIFALNISPKDHKYILVTGHRRENFGAGFESICLALREIAESNRSIDIIYPVHLNPNVREPVNRIIGNCVNIHLIEPVEYLSFIFLMANSYFIITDSGGVQEEAPSLGKPVLVTRDTTERPEAEHAGTVKLVGTSKKLIVSMVTELLNNQDTYTSMSSSRNPYGDGSASKKIVAILKEG